MSGGLAGLAERTFVEKKLATVSEALYTKLYNAEQVAIGLLQISQQATLTSSLSPLHTQ